ncbi:beta-glucuronidase [Chitinophaga sp. CF418]|uniref:beta-glucuronidase n=1 Tax=Chitinophaga sp. CF418 TaxID=1855287 RepID=UPI000911489B|nr:beta-glucuronidase [Chitinophaga sp. CF418]SHN33207.1 beta-glucuronidase [Chitinophaga sp. CF418]
MKSLLTILFVCLSVQMNGQDFRTANTEDIALFPQQNEFRNTLDLSGIWKFKKDSLAEGEKQQWFKGLSDYRSIAVPGSWNEQFDDMRDYLAMAWYEKETYIPASWKGQRIFIRVGSANYAAKIWVNGQPLGQHEGGHLPFAFEISSLVNWNASNRITIQVENILKPDRVPTGGDVATGLFNNFPKSNYDFFPYAGLHRAVWLYTVPSAAAIADVAINTGFTGNDGAVEIKVVAHGKASQGRISIAGIQAPIRFSGGKATASIKIPNVRRWSPEDPFLYTVDVTLTEGNKTIDHYTTETGVRTITANSKQILLNGKPIFLKGFGKHEDFPIYGRGTAYPVMIKDFSLFKWIGANSFRTSHYPYDEEYMRMADREGILVIDEIPAVGLYFHGDTAQLQRRQSVCHQYINELITRDKNHPSVIIWCIANEPFPAKVGLTSGEEKQGDDQALVSLKTLFKQVKTLDSSRLTTLVGVMGGPSDWLTLGDVTCVNRYWGWYTNPGDVRAGAAMLSMELDRLHQKVQKPVIITEFGADTYPGMHAEQPEMFTEEYQTDFIKAYLDVADSKDFIAGMHVWAFADFKTSQAIMRFGGINYKGVFTRDRKPKMAAHYLRQRWARKN